MMKIPGLKNEYSNPLLLDLINYYESCRFKATDGYNAYLEAAKHFAAEVENKELITYALEAEKPLGPDMFDMAQIAPKKVFPLIMGFNNFVRAVQDAGSGRVPAYANLRGVQRKAVPDLKSFNYVGHNDLDIDHRPANYSLLF
ncbi:hypothetical protein [Mucilaginibacter pedocola]|uniref:Uncharacterized protein n=1 Tax=Mucilaginibacter pedocola TaxID=1792845 RepID=A0A1S9PGD2_9SPHI|nr:hypothetical protein [Mucilaginibacter pedocola]OOQ60006.1 hypothetical protein BC343_27130 [Mucilaginibacter pedocola]